MGRGGPNEMTEFLGWLDLNRSDGQIGFTGKAVQYTSLCDIENVTSLMYGYHGTAPIQSYSRTAPSRPDHRQQNSGNS